MKVKSTDSLVHEISVPDVTGCVFGVCAAGCKVYDSARWISYMLVPGITPSKVYQCNCHSWEVTEYKYFITVLK